MMNNSSITVALTNDVKKSYREYNYKKLTDKCKTSEVILPFDTHYEILIKNENSSRIKIDIDIDGTIITGAGLIVNGNGQAQIERFVDSTKKLFFTKKTNEKVADPTNKENGFLTVKVSKEKPFAYTFKTNFPTDPYNGVYDYYNYRTPTSYPSWLPYRGLMSGDIFIGPGNTSSGHGSITTFTSTMNASSNLSSNPIFKSTEADINYCDTGATVEGDNSNQTFQSTLWNGEEIGSDFIFQFKMLGQEVKLSPQEEKDIMEYKRLKAKFQGI